MKRRPLVAAQNTLAFMRWWSAELHSCLSDLQRIVFPRWQRALILFIDERRIVWIDRQPGMSDHLHEIARPNWKAALPEVLPEPILGTFAHSRAVLHLGAKQAFVRRLRLPLAALPHLKTAISLQLGKLMPLDPALLLTDFVVANVDPITGTLDIDLAALKRADIEPMVSRIHGWGFRITSIQLSEGPESVPRFRFTDAEKHRGVKAMGRVNRVLISTTAALSLVCVGVSAAESYRARRALDQAEQHFAVTAGIALDRRQRLLTRLEPLVTLSRLEHTPAAALLADVTALVPRDTWLTTFEFKDRRLRIVGISPDSATLVKQLSSSTLLTDVELRSSMSAGVGTGKDRFEITADTKSGAP